MSDLVSVSEAFDPGQPLASQTLFRKEERRRSYDRWRDGLGRGLQTAFSGLDWLFGWACLVAGLAVVSVLPVLNFLSLGYLVHASGQVARTGRLSAGFVGIRQASVLGGFVLGSWLVYLPVRFVAGMWRDALLVDPQGKGAGYWQLALWLLTVAAAFQIVWACFRGGKLRHFLWPAPLRFWHWLGTSGKGAKMRSVVLEFVEGLRLPYYFWLGIRAFAGAFLWLAVPVGVLILAAQFPAHRGGGLLSVVGALALVGVVLYLPFLQTRFAIEQRFGALFEVGEIRRLFLRAPVAFWLGLLSTLVSALPLYLLKIELPPREIAWLPSLLFVLFILPARFLTGWAVGRALRREQPRHRFFRWTSRLAVVPVALLYVVFVYLTQYLSWNGSLSLLEQHAFLVPAPLLGL